MAGVGRKELSILIWDSSTAMANIVREGQFSSFNSHLRFISHCRRRRKRDGKVALSILIWDSSKFSDFKESLEDAIKLSILIWDSSAIVEYSRTKKKCSFQFSFEIHLKAYIGVLTPSEISCLILRNFKNLSFLLSESI